MIVSGGYRKKVLEFSSWEIPEPGMDLPVGTALLKPGAGCGDGRCRGRQIGPDAVLFDPLGEMRRFRVAAMC